MKTSMRARLLACSAVALGWAAAAPAQAAPTAERFPLGRSASTGAICEAVRDYDDPAAQGRRSKVWRVQCRGFSVPLGRIYAFAGVSDAAWRGEAAKRATCAAPAPAAVAGLSDAGRAACKAADSGAPYLVYTARGGGAQLGAEGFAQVADVLEAGLRIVADVTPPPDLAEAQASPAQAEIAAAFGGDLPGLAAATEAAASAPERLRRRGYQLNNDWRFADAENDFRALVQAADSRNAGPRDRAEATLNLALNVSNTGRFAEAEGLLGRAEALLPEADEPVLTARALNYRALHLRNQGKFAEAVAAADAAVAARAELRRSGALGGGLQRPVINAAIARALNAGDLPGAVDAEGLTPEQQLQIQDAQALQTAGSAKAALGDTAGARSAFEQAAGLLDAYARPGSVLVWLRARVQNDLALMDLAEGRPAEAAARLTAARALLRTRHAGSLTEGALLFDLAQAEAKAGNRPAAMSHFAEAFAVFGDQRGSLGPSAPAAALYFDMLLEQADPAATEAFFAASQAVLSDATAQATALLAARVASGDAATTGLARALDDTRRLVKVKEGEIARAQTEGADASIVAARQAELADLQRQAGVLETQLLAADPRYGQLVGARATLAELRGALQPDEAYAKVFFVGDAAFGVLVTLQGAKPYKLLLTRPELDLLVDRVRAPFDDQTNLRRFDVGAAHLLHTALFSAVQAELAPAKRLIYEPSGPLISVPPSILVTDAASAERLAARQQPGTATNYSDVAWLAANTETALSVSPASFLQSRGFTPSGAGRPFLGFADPTLGPQLASTSAFESVTRRGAGEVLRDADICRQVRESLLRLRPLPETLDETAAVARAVGAGPSDIVSGGGFTDLAVEARPDLKDYRVLYFATHGLLPNAEHCLPEPALVTSAAPGGDALLESSEVVELRLDADLIVLSACDTGRQGSPEAGAEGGGEALGGLVRAFIYAGARGMLVSHWAIDSQSSKTLMIDVFRSGAPTQAAALRSAQLKMLRDPALSHPYFWGPFTLVGDGARALPGA